jgi:glyceraldehyde 3-phosphate dehydrogenase
MIRVAINGYGRIGRIAHRVILERFYNDVEVVAINAGSSTDIKGWMYLLKYDSVYGPILSLEIGFEEANPEALAKGQIGSLIIEGKKIPVFSQKDPSLLPWRDLAVDVVVESTGHFKTEEKLKLHLTAGAKAVVLSAPAKEGGVPTYVLGVNATSYKGEPLINNASCTTNCIAPVAKIMVNSFGVEKAMMTTIHGYTSDQKLEDGGHKDYRRARAAALNIIPTSTGATTAAAQTVPELAGIFSGLSVRVPVPVGSLADFTFVLKRETTKEEVNNALKQAAQNTAYAGILEVTEDPIVSSDIIGSAASSIVDLSLTQVVGGNLVKIIAWYDNEYGYANRLIEEVLMVGKKQEIPQPVNPIQNQVEAPPSVQAGLNDNQGVTS